MPSETFFNLPEEKRERVLDAAIKEFAQHPYHKSSINRIVEEADIAKGSFYQYFSDKKDLFKYIVELITEEKMTYISKAVAEKQNLNFFELLRELYLAGFRFTKEHPRLQLVAFRIINLDNQLKEEILDKSEQKSDQFFIKLLEEGIKKEEIDPNIDIEFTAYLITQLNISVLEDYFWKKLEFDNEEDLLAELSKDKLMHLVDKILYFIRNGIEKNS
ncbi:TetR/AcrR family transcriptional regulator [Fuchsiella alkaliacetigena]|uniref:TetR/AcrR family transcriptional regulator n=1 Tax=Fuchsiella alkaliacetigena TaxID=957042 RepID=UPI00200B5309|nr:TetR/AcrR family transcriptional regulator [Fuchsiella alkaliacetigena]MCK8824142.1 TetR/AcrR family transcriptional regulator [Fuchsiella alkaliacetigena]